MPNGESTTRVLEIHLGTTENPPCQIHRAKSTTDDEMLTAGVASRARTGSLIDRFRDRLVFPITHNEQVLGFVARRDPAHTDDDNRGPKYLNTPETPLFHKGDQLFMVPAAGSTPVLAEGPLDAVAVALAAGSTHFGVAPLGTALTMTQASQLAAFGSHPTVATDGDAAGWRAAERSYWLLASHGVAPQYAEVPDGYDPADLLRLPSHDLEAVLRQTRPLGEAILDAHFSQHRSYH